MTDKERLAKILEIAEGYQEYMSDPEQDGEHYDDCPLAGSWPENYPGAYDEEVSPDDPEDITRTWNPEKAAVLCECSVGAFWRIAQLARSPQ